MIADDEALKEKLLGDLKLYPVEDAEYLVAFSGLQKLAALNDEDSYIIDTKATVRQAAKKFGISKSTVHMEVTI